MRIIIIKGHAKGEGDLNFTYGLSGLQIHLWKVDWPLEMSWNEVSKTSLWTAAWPRHWMAAAQEGSQHCRWGQLLEPGAVAKDAAVNLSASKIPISTEKLVLKRTSVVHSSIKYSILKYGWKDRTEFLWLSRFKLFCEAQISFSIKRSGIWADNQLFVWHSLSLGY